MPDQMTTTGSFGGGGRKEETVSDAVAEAVENLRQAMLDRGDDPGAVEAKLHMVKPNETNLVGNYADLQRMGAIATTGTMPTPPTEEDIETSNIEDAFVEPQPQGDVDEEGKAPNVAADTEEDGGYDSYTKAELQADLDERGIEYSSNATKAELVDLANS